MILSVLPVTVDAEMLPIVAGEIISFTPLEYRVAEQTFPFGTGLWALNLPVKLLALVRGIPLVMTSSDVSDIREVLVSVTVHADIPVAHFVNYVGL